MRFRFVTSTPLDALRGSGTFVGITTLANALGGLGATVKIDSPAIRIFPYTLSRVLFNQALRLTNRYENECDATVGFDMDGYTLANRKHGHFHIASIKGVIADEAGQERGITRTTLQLQAACERLHVRRADCVFATSQYSARRIQQLYGVREKPRIIPELIDLATWRDLLERSPGTPRKAGFVVLCVCRFYPRKRVGVLLGAAERLRDKIAGLEVRIVGGGPEEGNLRAMWRKKNLEGVVTWRKDISQSELASEYKCCDMFCLPSVQEGFGIVFLEAMASGKPIVAAQASSTPEVVKRGLLVKPDDEEALAGAIERLYLDGRLRQRLGAAGAEFVQQFDAPVVASLFLREVELARSGRTASIQRAVAAR